MISIIVFIFIMGIGAYISVPKQEYPVIPTPAATIRVTYPGINAADMEELVTKKVEDVAMEIDEHDDISSSSLNGVSIVTVEFDPGMSVDKLNEGIENLRNKIEDLKDNDLPSGVTDVSFDTASLETAGMILAFSSDGQSKSVLAQKAEDLKEDLINMNGVRKVEILGKRREKIEINVNSKKLNHTSLSLGDIVNTVSAQNSIMPIGSLDMVSNKITVNSSGAVDDLNEIGNIIIQVSEKSGSYIKLKDVATIKKVEDENNTRFSYNGKDVVILSLYFKESINMVNVGSKIMDEVDEFISQIPSNIKIDKVTFLPNDVGKSINDFTINLIQSIIIVLIVVMIGMSFRNGAIVSIAIPLSIFIAFIAMMLLKVDIQFVSLAALIVALGMLVDNAIVISDAIQVRIDNEEERISACIDGVKEVALPVLTSTLTTVAIFAIFFIQPGTMGIFVSSLPTIVIVALSASYVISILVTPLMCYLLIKKSLIKKHKKTHIKDFFTNLLDIGLRHKIITIVLAFGLVLISTIVLTSLDMELLPNSTKPILDVDVTTSNISNIDETKEVMNVIEKKLGEFPEIESYLLSIGGRVPKYSFSANTATESIDKGSVMLKINLKEGNRFNSKAEFAEYLQGILKNSVPGSKVIVSELGVVPSMGSPIQVKLAGDDLEELNRGAVIVEEELEKIEGTKNISSDRKIKMNEFYLDMKNDVINPYGLTKSIIQNELNIALMGRDASTYRKNSEEYPIIVKSDIQSLKDMKNYMFKSTSTRNKYQLKQIADVGLKADYASISRYNGKRIVTVGASAKDGYSADTLQKKLKNILGQKDLGKVEVIYKGDSDVLGDALGSLAMGAIIGIMIILVVLMIQFNSFKQVGIIVSSVPLGLIGATIGLVIFNKPISMFTMLGIISLIGVVVNNAIVLVDFINEERVKGTSVDDACREAVSKRFRPIILSTTTTVVGLIPLAMPGNPLFQGMAIAFMSGLGFSVLFTLIVIPVVYAIFEGKQNEVISSKL